MLLDGTVAETDRVRAKGHFSGKVRREGVNLQVITAEERTRATPEPAATVITPIKRRPDTELADKHMKSNKVHAALRAPVERTISRIKQWRIFRHARTSPNRLTSAVTAILTLMIYT
ncbi:transposase family protein [Streptomyces sp. ET3-23]|uniref:transposase family protein n=1 Tax=Streptomyces sp. ET3-23 TaxID=2885643 RepID=UPI001D10AA30|nr:transposase family protein [Streptomyces sp. ET3-23]MCC2280974.1 transposase family protein [Streptomyces sp. ET3-23]